MNLMNATPEPFNAQRQSQIDQEEYQRGFEAATRGELNNTSQTLAWHRGWADAQGCRSQSPVLPASHYIRSENNKNPHHQSWIRGLVMGASVFPRVTI